MSALLKAIDVTKRFRRNTVLNGLNLDVPEGSVYGLLGPNGVGKTTTIKILMNIIQAGSGRAEALGTDSRKLGPKEFAQIGYVSENQEMPEWMTVAYFMAYLRPFYPTWDREREQELLRQFDLPLDRKLKHLSRGMRMKAALASSLAYRPKLIVLDEPFTGLDPLVRDEFIQGLLENAEGTTMLISSHDLAEIESFASHIGYLDRGRLEFSEEMTALNDRFRDVEVTLNAEVTFTGAVLAPEWPASWLGRESSASVVRFVESQFEQHRTLEQVRRVFGEVQRVTLNPMPLREIFVTLARAGRKAA